MQPSERRASAGFRSRGVLWVLLMALPVAAWPVRPAAADDAKSIISRMTNAHGGLEAWRQAPSVSFMDKWMTPTGEVRQSSLVRVEQGRRRSLIEYPADSAVVAWDGETCWSLNWDSPVPPRFFLLLTYYFACLPWVAHDPGVVLHEPTTRRLWDDPTEYISVRITYEPGTGDTPDDYYVLFIDPQSYELAGCAYVVTYPELVPEGKLSTPEHILMYDELTTINGLKVPAGFTVYNKDHSVYATCAISDWSFSEPFDATALAMPAGAETHDLVAP